MGKWKGKSTIMSELGSDLDLHIHPLLSSLTGEHKHDERDDGAPFLDVVGSADVCRFPGVGHVGGGLRLLVASIPSHTEYELSR